MRLSGGVTLLLRARSPLGIGTTCQQVLIRRHGYRPAKSTRYYSIHTDASKLDSLPYQDEWESIRFLPFLGDPEVVLARFGLDWSSVNLTAHVIPFWTLLYQFDTHLHIEKEAHGGIEISCSSEALDLSCSIAAVPRGHWCHGVMLPTSFTSLKGAVEDDSSLSEAPEKSPAKLFSSLMPYRYAINNVFSEKFAMGVPELDADVWASLLLDQTLQDNVRCHRKPLRLPTVHATPIYRPVYKMVFKDGTIAYIDGYARTPLHWFTIERANGRSYMDPARWNAKRYSSDVLEKEVKGIHLAHASPNQFGKSHILPTRVCDNINDKLLKAAQETPVDFSQRNIVALGAPNWGISSDFVQHVCATAERRLEAASVGPVKRITDCSDMDFRNQKRLEGGYPSAQQYPGPAKKSSEWASRVRLVASGMPFAHQATSHPIFMPRPKPPPAPRAWRSGSSTSTTFPPPSSPPNNPIPPSNKRPNFKTNVDPHLFDERSSSQRRGEAKSTKKPSSPRSPPKPPPKQPANDLMGHYKTLGVEPQPNFTHVDSGPEIDKRLARQYHRLAMKHHPDRQGSDQSHRTMTEINAAFDAVKTLEARKRYHQGE